MVSKYPKDYLNHVFLLKYKYVKSQMLLTYAFDIHIHVFINNSQVIVK